MFFTFRRIFDMTTDRIVMFDTPIDRLTLNETVGKVVHAIRQNKQHHHFAVNVAKIVNMQKDKNLYESVVSADIINADGAPLVWVSRLFGRPLPERVAGIDLMEALVARAHERGYKIFFLGAREEVVKKVAEIYAHQYGVEILAGYRNGYFDEQTEPEVVRQIASSGANILFVAMTSPKKEIFLHKYKEQLRDLNFIMGVGGSFDVVAGKVKRAPKWMQKCGLEWLFRVIQEPGRMWKRYLVTNTLFVYYILKEVFKPKTQSIAEHKNVS